VAVADTVGQGKNAIENLEQHVRDILEVKGKAQKNIKPILRTRPEEADDGPADHATTVAAFLNMTPAARALAEAAASGYEATKGHS
jgi:hypothetical protein